jgi:hypothetical protein
MGLFHRRYEIIIEQKYASLSLRRVSSPHCPGLEVLWKVEISVLEAIAKLLVENGRLGLHRGQVYIVMCENSS